VKARPLLVGIKQIERITRPAVVDCPRTSVVLPRPSGLKLTLKVLLQILDLNSHKVGVDADFRILSVPHVSGTKAVFKMKLGIRLHLLSPYYAVPPYGEELSTFLRRAVG